MSENLFKENIEKSKKVLKDHFERRKQERSRDLWVIECTTSKMHCSVDWDINDEEFDDDLKEFFDKLIWSNNIKEEENKKEVE